MIFSKTKNIPLVIQYPHYCFIGNKENDGEWNSVSSYKEVTVDQSRATK